jgi:class 3 adenylate cyclase
VHRYEGTVNQVMGDGIMALFGAPIAHEDHAVRRVTPHSPCKGRSNSMPSRSNGSKASRSRCVWG